MLPKFDASAYLRGREVAVRLRPIGGGEPEPVWLRLSNWHVAQVEEEFGGVAALDEAFDVKPSTTLVRFFAIALGHKLPLVPDALEQVADRMVDTEYAAYCGALQGLWHLAHGGSEEDAGKAMAAKAEMVLQASPLEAQILQAAAAMVTGGGLTAETLEVLRKLIVSPGTNGSRPGRARAKRSTSSGA